VMPRNVEIKARVRDLEALRRRAEALSDAPVEVLDQRDTFFDVPQGRLKLRRLDGGACELIYYERPDEAGAKVSEYSIARASDAGPLLRVLSAALPVRGVVVKRRFVYRIGRTRVHLDLVDRLGAFVELEVVLEEDARIEDGCRTAEELLVGLGIRSEDRVSGAYIDLLEADGR